MARFLAALFVVSAIPATAGEVRVSGFTAADVRWFPQSPRFDGQFSGVETSAVINPEFRYQADDGGLQVTFIPFVRLSGRDAERTHFDIREAYVAQRLGDWDYLVGINKVFWGVTESRHLVNIINQTDAIEDTDGDDPTAAMAAVTSHLEANVPWGARVRITPGASAAPYALATTGAGYDAFRAAFAEAWDRPPLEIGIGGSIPFVAAFAAAFPESSLMLTATGDPSSRIHGPNESQDLGDLKKACLAEAIALRLLGED